MVIKLYCNLDALILLSKNKKAPENLLCSTELDSSFNTEIMIDIYRYEITKQQNYIGDTATYSISLIGPE